MSLTSKQLETGYTILRLVTDPLRGETIPVGAVAWDARRGWYGIRALSKKERVPGVNSNLRRVVQATTSQLTRWAEAKHVPYAGNQEPSTSDFWAGVGRILTAGVRLDPPRAMQAMEIEDEFDALFEAVVQPVEPPGEKRQRIESVVNEALGPISKKFGKRVPVKAFERADEKVLRAYKSRQMLVVIEAVNLAGSEAVRDADALVSRLNRIRVGEEHKKHAVVFLVGYRASPGGLNGESHMKHWIQQEVTPHVYDLHRDRTRLRSVALEKLIELGEQVDVFDGRTNPE